MIGILVRLIAVLSFGAVLLTSAVVRADDVRRAGTVRLEAAGKGPLELKSGREGMSGELSIVNGGREPLIVSRIAVRGEAADPRVPGKVVARLAEGSLPVTIAPGAARKAVVTFLPERGNRQKQLFGHVVVTSSDEQSGEVAMGIRAQSAGPLAALDGHAVSLLVGLPLLGALVMLLARAAGRRDDKTPHVVATVTLALHVAVAVYVYQGFTVDVSRLDGNDGLQFVEHALWIRSIAAEIYFGVDGTNVGPLLVTSLVAFLGLLSERSVFRGAAGYHAGYLLLVSAASGALTAMDGLLFVLFVTSSVVAASLLVGAWGSPARRRAGVRLAVLGILASAALTVALVAVAKHADPTFLVDGTKTTLSFSLPELSRVALGAKGATLLGFALPKVAFVLVLFASLALLGAFPLHGWINAVLAEAPTPVGALVAAALPSLGTVTLLRVGASVLPEGMRWASGVVVALGAVSACYGALASLGQTDLRRLAAGAVTSQVGFVLLGAGSLTPQGLSGALVLTTTRALSCAVFLMLVGAVDDRVAVRDARKLSGIASQMPGFATALGVAAFAQAGIVGFGGAWGPLLALLGALPNYAPLALVSVIATVVLAAAHVSALSHLAFGPLAPDWERAPRLEPFGGRFPDLTPREWSGVLPLVLLVAVLGLWPAPLFATTSGTVRDLTNAVNPPGPDQIAARGRSATASG